MQHTISIIHGRDDIGIVVTDKNGGSVHNLTPARARRMAKTLKQYAKAIEAGDTELLGYNHTFYLND